MESAEGEVPGYICNYNFYCQNISETKSKSRYFQTQSFKCCVIKLNHE